MFILIYSTISVWSGTFWLNCFDIRAEMKLISLPILFRVAQKSEVSSEAHSRLKLPSPTLKKKQKEKDKKNKKFKKDQKRPQARLLQERCVHCHELFSQVGLNSSNYYYWIISRNYNNNDYYWIISRIMPLVPVATLPTFWSKASSACLALPVPSVFFTTVITRMKTLQVNLRWLWWHEVIK